MRSTYPGGRPSKGPRKQLPAKVPMAIATEVEERAAALEITVTEYIRRVLSEHLVTTPRPESGQGVLLPYSLEELSHSA